jgi:hypothetical protein
MGSGFIDSSCTGSLLHTSYRLRIEEISYKDEKYIIIEWINTKRRPISIK